ncbi:e169c475-39d8-4dbb-a6c2-479a670f6d4f-CDS [Sclerotinia trifoliorum]|uniref:E169c475-39d8-4dbb-a6c2-479a670f6d4f-CDS n=1 Tax=Sclerotinia trifoliorum TaxID=28548 RepID=A0A8H2VM47_9HELO|nr:e169c475-39d8-4dbb-a6c2-479a670f6d4f-CDS [Sclerotinia trifoliorum]
MVYELIHAMELSRNYPNPNIKMTAPPVPNEPYFEDAALAELGYSYENAVVVGRDTCIPIVCYEEGIGRGS